MRIASLCSGVGGAECGWARAGHPVVALAESDAWRRGILALRFPDAQLAADVSAAWPVHPNADLLYVDTPGVGVDALWPSLRDAAVRTAARWVVVELGLGPCGATVRDLSAAGYDVQLVHVEVRIEAAPLPPEAWDVRRRLLVIAGATAALKGLGLRDTLVTLSAKTRLNVAAWSVEGEEQSRALPAGWTCACGDWRLRCQCPEAARRSAVREATSPVLTRWLADVFAGRWVGGDYKREMERGATCVLQA